MKKTIKICLPLAILAVVACTKKPDEEPEVQMPPEESQVSFMDTASLKSVALNLVQYIPTWEELERFTEVAERLTLPTFEKWALPWTGLPGEEEVFDRTKDWMPQVLDYNKTLVKEFGANGSSALMTSVPPFLMPDGSAIPVPFPLDILDQRLRATTVLFLYEKSLGLPVTFVNFYPPNQELEKFSTKSAFNQWFESRYLPEKIAEAKAAELMKAEKVIPWPLEFEILIAEIGGIGDGGFLDGVSDEEVLAFANEVKTSIFNATKANYNGNIVAHLYNNYQRPGFDYWDQMSYSEFDEIQFSLFPPLNVEGAEAYMDEQLIHIMKIVENSGNVPWMGGVSVFEWYVEDGKLEEYERNMYKVTFEKMELAPIPPIGVAASAGYMVSQEAKDYLKSYFDAH